jgi:hypothetical protein
MQSSSKYTKLLTVNDMLRSFDLENNHENLEEQKDNPFDYLLQSNAWEMSMLKCCLYSEQILRPTMIKAEALEKGSTQKL